MKSFSSLRRVQPLDEFSPWTSVGLWQLWKGLNVCPYLGASKQGATVCDEFSWTSVGSSAVCVKQQIIARPISAQVYSTMSDRSKKDSSMSDFFSLHSILFQLRLEPTETFLRRRRRPVWV